MFICSSGEVAGPQFKSWLYHLWALWFWASYKPQFAHLKSEDDWDACCISVGIRTEWANVCEMLSTVPGNAHKSLLFITIFYVTSFLVFFILHSAQGSTSLFYKRPDNKYFRFCGLHGLSHNERLSIPRLKMWNPPKWNFWAPTWWHKQKKFTTDLMWQTAVKKQVH